MITSLLQVSQARPSSNLANGSGLFPYPSKAPPHNTHLNSGTLEWNGFLLTEW